MKSFAILLCTTLGLSWVSANACEYAPNCDQYLSGSVANTTLSGNYCVHNADVIIGDNVNVVPGTKITVGNARQIEFVGTNILAQGTSFAPDPEPQFAGGGTIIVRPNSNVRFEGVCSSLPINAEGGQFNVTNASNLSRLSVNGTAIIDSSTCPDLRLYGVGIVTTNNANLTSVLAEGYTGVARFYGGRVNGTVTARGNAACSIFFRDVRFANNVTMTIGGTNLDSYVYAKSCTFEGRLRAVRETGTRGEIGLNGCALNPALVTDQSNALNTSSSVDCDTVPTATPTPAPTFTSTPTVIPPTFTLTPTVTPTNTPTPTSTPIPVPADLVFGVLLFVDGQPTHNMPNGTNQFEVYVLADGEVCDIRLAVREANGTIGWSLQTPIEEMRYEPAFGMYIGHVDFGRIQFSSISAPFNLDVEVLSAASGEVMWPRFRIR